MTSSRPHVLIEIRRDPGEHESSAEGLRVAVGLAAWEGLELTLVWRSEALDSLALSAEDWEWRGLAGQHLARLKELVPEWWAHPDVEISEVHEDWTVTRPAREPWVARCHEAVARLVF